MSWPEGSFADLNMPGLDGYGLTAAIRRHEEATRAGRTPILALSANVLQGEAEQCIAAGMDDFIGKPTTIPFLGGKLRRWLAHLEWPSPAGDGIAASGQDGGAPEQTIDESVLEELTGGDPQVAEVLRDFVETSRADVESLQTAVAAGAMEEVRRQAHRMKGASRLVGAPRLAQLAQELETLADADDVADPAVIRRLADDLVTALAAVEGAVSV